MRSFSRRSLAAAAVGGGLALGPVLVATPPAAAAAGAHALLYVSASDGKASNSGMSCLTAKYTVIQDAIDNASPGDTVVVCPGTYAPFTTMTTSGSVSRLTIVGLHAVVDAAGSRNGAAITGNGDTLRGFRVQNANGDGIVVTGSYDRIVANIAADNGAKVGGDEGDQCAEGGSEPAATEGGEEGNGAGIKLNGSSYSLVSHNIAVGNTHGGIAVMDQKGPASHNAIVANVARSNPSGPGIRLASPAGHGVFANIVRGNLLVGNGTTSPVRGGAGVLLGGSAAAGAVYGNLIAGNRISGNGLPGVLLHSRFPGQNMSGNVVTRNFIGVNNVVGCPGLGISKTTGIAVVSISSPVSIHLAGNAIAGDYYGVWLAGPVHAPDAIFNLFINVQEPVHYAS